MFRDPFMAELSTFEQYYKLADMLTAKATKEEIAECAGLLAPDLAHYPAKHVKLPWGRRGTD